MRDLAQHLCVLQFRLEFKRLSGVLGGNKSGSRLLWFFAFSQEAALSPMGRGFFAFYKAYPQKRITAEIELIDKRNVQTYVDGAVVRPLPIPSGSPPHSLLAARDFHVRLALELDTPVRPCAAWSMQLRRPFTSSMRFAHSVSCSAETIQSIPSL